MEPKMFLFSPSSSLQAKKTKKLNAHDLDLSNNDIKLYWSMFSNKK